MKEKSRCVLARPWPPKTAKEVQDRFERFWAAYPRKVAVGAAMVAFKRLSPSEELLGVMLEGLEWQTVEWEERPHSVGEWRDWVPHAGTWINGLRWLDQAPGRILRLVEARKRADEQARAPRPPAAEVLEAETSPEERARGEAIVREAKRRVREMTGRIGRFGR